MKKLLIIFSVLFALLLREECHGQGTVKYTAGISYGFGDPTYTPQGNVSKKYINLTTLRSSTYSGTSWVLDAQGIDVVSGCAAPAYTPGLGQSNIVLNNCTLLQNGQGPELYVFDGTSWIFINEKNTAPTYTAGTGIDITGTVISNTGDLSNTNEIQNLSLSGQTLGISSGNTVTLPVVAVAAGTGISVSNSSGTATVTNIAPDQVVSITGAGVNAVTGAYPNFTVTGTEVDGSVTNEMQTLSVAGNNLTISDGNTVTLPTPSSTLDGLTDVTITSPANNQILQYNSAGAQWVNSTISAITGSGISSYIPVFNSSSSVQAYSNFYFAGTSQGLIIGGIQFNGYGAGVGFTGQGFASPGGNRTLYMKSGTNNNAADEAGIWIDGGTLGGRTASSSFKGVKFFSDLQSNGPGILNTYAMISVEQRVRHSMTTVTGIDYNPQLDVTPTNNYAALFRTGIVSVGTASPNSSAKLDVTSTTQGVLFPRMTSTQRDAIASPPDGLVVYNTTAAKLQVRAASAWVDLH